MWLTCILIPCILVTAQGVSLDLSVCGVSKGCVTYPSGCDAASCVAAATWQNNNDGTINFELAVTGSTGSTNGWVAVGVSASQNMDATSIMNCVRNSGTDALSIGYSYNSGYSNAVLSTTNGLTNLSPSYVGSELKCSFTRQKTVTGTGEDAQIFDLAGTSYYVLIGYGNTAGATKSKHTAVPLASTQISSLESTTSLAADLTVNDKYKAHGILMIIAWVLFASVGMVVARYYKKAFGKICNLDGWFPIHRACMVTTFSLTTIAFIIIFAEKKGFSEYKNWTPTSTRAHPFLGIIVMALSIINPVMALVRPAPDATNRNIFNWGHWIVGTLAYIISIVTVFLGLKLPSSEGMAPDWLVWLMVGYVVFHVIVEIVLEVQQCTKKSKGEMSQQMKAPGEQATIEPPPEANMVFHKMLLGVYTLGVTAIVLIITIVIAIQ